MMLPSGAMASSVEELLTDYSKRKALCSTFCRERNQKLCCSHSLTYPSTHVLRVSVIFIFPRIYYYVCLSFCHLSEASIARYLLTDEQILANALRMVSGHRTGWLSQECLQTFGLFYWRASAGARVSPLMDRLGSAEVTFWQPSLC